MTATLATSSATTEYLQITPSPVREPLHGMFSVEVYGLDELVLIPRNDMARAVAQRWLASTTLQPSAEYRGVTEPWKDAAPGSGMQSFTIRFRIPALLSSGGDPHSSGRRLSDEEHAIALAAVEAHREQRANRRVPRPRQKAVAAKAGAL